MGSTSRHCLVAVFAIAGVLPFLVCQAQDDPAPENPCGKVYVNETGTIILPTSLQAGSCNITITRPENATANYTSLLVSNLVLKMSDYVTFYDGDYKPNSTDNLVAKITGRKEPFLVVVSSPAASIEVMITANNTGSTMTIDYSTIGCLQPLPAKQASLVQSPRYLPGLKEFECTYSVSGNASGLLGLSFQQFNLPNATLNITIEGNYSKTASGTGLPADVFGDSSLKMLLQVKDVNVTQNFSASLAPVTQDCSGETPVMGKTIMNNSLFPSSDCRDVFTASSGRSLVINITQLNLTNGGDRLTVVDGQSLGGHVLATLTKVPSAGYIVVSSGQNMIGHLVTDSVPAPAPRFISFSVSEQVGGHHVFVEGPLTIMAPNVTNTSITEYYVLEAGPGKQVKFDLEKAEANETFPYVITAYEGDQPVGSPIVSFSSSKRFPVVSKGSTMMVAVTFNNVTAHSISATVTFTNAASGCNQLSSGAQGNYQLKGETGLKPPCVWTIAPTDTSGTIEVELYDVSLPANTVLSIYSGVDQANTSLVAQFKPADILPGFTVPRIAITASAMAQLVFSASVNNTNLTQASVVASYQVIDKECGGQLSSKHGTFYSPNYPLRYPLNSVCMWTIPKSAPGRVLLFDFPSPFQLARGHNLSIVESDGTKTTVRATYTGNTPPADLIFNSNNTIGLTFSSQAANKSDMGFSAGLGFSVNYWMLNCGGNISMPNASFKTPGYPAVSNDVCVWIVKLPPMTGQSVNIVNMTLSVKATGGVKPENVITVRDGYNMSAPPLNITWADGKPAQVLSRYNTIIIILNYTAGDATEMSSFAKKMTTATTTAKTTTTTTAKTTTQAPSSGLALLVNYTTYACDKKNQCANGVCMHPDWRCNHVNDCGDGSDEIDCAISPAPSTSGMVRSYWVAICLLIGLVLGVVFTILLPRIIRRLRGHPYQPFRDEPVVT